MIQETPQQPAPAQDQPFQPQPAAQPAKKGKKKEETLKTALRGYKTLTGGTKQALEGVGLMNLDNNKHSKFLYYGDERYAVNLAKTPSDSRTGMNITKEIAALLF